MASLVSLTHTVCPLRVVVLDKVTDVLLFFGKLLVVGGVGKEWCIRKMFSFYFIYIKCY